MLIHPHLVLLVVVVPAPNNNSHNSTIDLILHLLYVNICKACELLYHGADPNAKTNNGVTPVMV